MIAALLLAIAPLQPVPSFGAAAPLLLLAPQKVEAQVSIPELFIEGQPFMVEVTYDGGEKGVSLEAWRVGPAAFDLDGKALAKRDTRDDIELPAGSSLTLRLNLTEFIESKSSFTLELADGDKDARREVRGLAPAPENIDFMKLSPEELKAYQVLLRTNRGDIMLAFRPDLAPGHVRNYLDLCQSGFYDGALFHRVSPTFMVQGGCPNTKTERKNAWGTGSGPRMLEAEFSDTPHERGVLSMARGNSPNSGSCQFFLMTAKSPHLDGKYSVFGNMVSGFETLDRIANSPGRVNPTDRTVRPNEPQRIEATLVLLAPAD